MRIVSVRRGWLPVLWLTVVADERGQAADDGLQAELIGVPGAIGSLVGGACRGPDADRQRVGGRVEDLVQQGRMRGPPLLIIHGGLTARTERRRRPGPRLART